MTRAAAALCALAALVVALPASAARVDETVRIPIGFPVKTVTTKTSIPPDKPVTLLLTGAHTVTEVGIPNPRKTKYDALYCIEGETCGTSHPGHFLLQYKSEKEPNRGT